MKPNVKRSLAPFLILAALLALYPTQAHSAGRRYVSIAAGRVSGAFFPMAGSIARTTRKPLRVKGIRVSAESTAGQAQNAVLISQGEYELAIIQNVVAAEAIKGSKPLFSRPLTNLAGVCALAFQAVHLLARPEAGINTLADLKGKKVGLGLTGSGTRLNAHHLLTAWGLKPADLAAVQSLRPAQAMEYLKTGRLEAAFFTAAAGEANLVSLAAQTPLKLVPIEGPNVEWLISRYPGYEKQVIAGGTLKGNPKNVPTVSITALLITRRDLEEGLVGDILEAVFDNLTKLGRYDPDLAGLSLEKAVLGLTLPWHPEAQKFFQAKGALD